MLYLFAGMCTMQWVSLGPGDESSGPPQRRSNGESQAALCSMARKGLQYPMYLRSQKYPEVNQSVWKMHSSFLTLHFPQCPPPDQTQLCPATSSLGARTPRVSMAVSTRGLLSHHIWQNGTDLTQCPQTRLQLKPNISCNHFCSIILYLEFMALSWFPLHCF